MPERVSKDGTRVTITEYERREVDQYGDALNVESFDTLAEALRDAESFISGDIVAVVIEKHISRRPSFCFNDPDTYTTIRTFGSADALHAGGWDRD